MAEGYAALNDASLAGRAVDLADVSRQVLANLPGATYNLEPPAISEPGILVAVDLTPADAAHLNPQGVLGVCTALGGPTSHAAILARLLGIPYVRGWARQSWARLRRSWSLMDGATGQVWFDPPANLLAEYIGRGEIERTARTKAREVSRAPAMTRDSRRVDVGANIGSILDAQAAVEGGATASGYVPPSSCSRIVAMRRARTNRSWHTAPWLKYSADAR
jgi:phosphocarrier protein FPr